MLKSLVMAAVLAIVGTPALSDGSDLVDYLSRQLDDLRQGVEAREGAPEDPGFFERGKGDIQKDIDRLLDRALGLVAPDTYRNRARQLARIDEAVTRAEARQAELMLDRMEAETSQGVGMVRRLLGEDYEPGSLEAIDGQLAEADAALGQLMQDREAVIAGFVEDMRARHGIELSQTQARALLFSVNGSLVVESSLVMQTLAGIERNLAELTRGQIGPEARRTYTGIASVTRLLQARMLQRHLAAYDEDWLPRLEEMRAETEALLEDTRRNAAGASQEGVRATFTNNALMQERILHVIAQYEAMLQRQRQATSDALDLASERADAAVNTLLTLETAASLATVISDATAGYDAVMQIELPELEQLDLEEFEQMLDISRRLGS